MPLLTV